MLMLLGDPGVSWVSGTLVDTESLPEDDWHIGDPLPLAGAVQLDSGATLLLLGNGPGSHATLTCVGNERLSPSLSTHRPLRVPPWPSTPCPFGLMPLIRGCSAGSKGKLEITNDSMAPSRGGTHATLFLDSPAPSETLGAEQIDLGVRAAPATVLPVPLPLSDEADPWPRGPAVAADLLDAVRTVRRKTPPPPPSPWPPQGP